MNVAFDTLTYAKELEAAGFTPQQAEVQALALARVVDEKLATKADTAGLEANLEALKAELKRDIKELEERLTYRLTLRMGTMLVAAVGVIATLIRIL